MKSTCNFFFFFTTAEHESEKIYLNKTKIKVKGHKTAIKENVVGLISWRGGGGPSGSFQLVVISRIPLFSPHYYLLDVYIYVLIISGIAFAAFDAGVHARTLKLAFLASSVHVFN